MTVTKAECIYLPITIPDGSYEMLSRCRELSGYHMEGKTVDHIGLLVWKVSRFMYDIYIFSRFRKSVSSLHPLQKAKCFVSTKHSILFQWKVNVIVLVVTPSLISIWLLYFLELVPVLNMDEIVAAGLQNYPRLIKKTINHIMFKLSYYLSLFLYNKRLLLTSIDMHVHVILSTLKVHWTLKLTKETL